jgi:hypothetical protein
MAVFRVSELWKGPRQPVIALFGGSGIDCGVYFEVDREYLVFADEVRPKQSIGLVPSEYGRSFLSTLCGGTKQLGESARREIQDIRESYPSWRPIFADP